MKPLDKAPEPTIHWLRPEYDFSTRDIVILMALFLVLSAACVWQMLRDLESIDRKQQAIEAMHAAERIDAIDFRLWRLELDLMRD